MHRSRPSVVLGSVLLVLGAADAGAFPQGKKGAPKNSLQPFETFTQVEWGEPATEGGKAARLRNTRFKDAFPRGLTIGSRRRGCYSYTLETAHDVERFLPEKSDLGIMTEDGRQGAKAGGGLAGQLVAAKLNVAFNDQRLFNKDEWWPGNRLRLADLILIREVPNKLLGMRVSELIALADRALGGEFGQHGNPEKRIVDADGDGRDDTSIATLRSALVIVNYNFNRGDPVKRCLAIGPRPPGWDGPADDEDDAAVAVALAKLESSLEKALSDRDAALSRAEDGHARQLKKLEADFAGKPLLLEKKTKELKERHETERERILAEYETRRERIFAEYAATVDGSEALNPHAAAGGAAGLARGRQLLTKAEVDRDHALLVAKEAYEQQLESARARAEQEGKPKLFERRKLELDEELKRERERIEREFLDRRQKILAEYPGLREKK